MYNNYMWVMEVLTSLTIINHYIVVVNFTERRNHNINHPELIDKVNVVSSTPCHG
jgi:hypothetical protein